jgi:sulfide-dependent adenosine diphosphate thiazole synthase
MRTMEEVISTGIVDRFYSKLRSHMTLDVAIVGAGPSGLLAAKYLAEAGKRVAVYERKLAPGGGTWGGGMLFSEIVVQKEVVPIIESLGVRYAPLEEGYVTLDSVEISSALIYHACHAGAVVFNAMSVDDVVFRDCRIAGVVINWSPVGKLGLHVDPLVIPAKVVVDATGHPSEIAALVAKKAGMRLDTPSGGVEGERPMWMERGEAATVENTKQLCPGFYASGMAANNISGGYRMGPVFGGMFLSGQKVARLILNEIG